MQVDSTPRPLPRLRAHWFDRWHDELDAALNLLPDMETCPHELYRELATSPTGVEKRIALVSDRDMPVAVVAVRRYESIWAPITTWVVPGAMFPVRAGYLADVLAQLRLPLFLAWWRQEGPPPSSMKFEQMKSVATRRLTCQGDYEAYWNQTGLMTDIRKARKRCQHLRIAVNIPGAAEWTLRKWGRKWAPSGMEEKPDTGDRVIVARYWEPRGRHFTLSLLDGDTIAAAGSVFAHGRDVIGLASFRGPAYERLSIGTRLLDAVHGWARDAGFEGQDFGGGQAYKERWAPEGGTRWEFIVESVESPVLRLANALRRRAAVVGSLLLPAR